MFYIMHHGVWKSMAAVQQYLSLHVFPSDPAYLFFGWMLMRDRPACLHASSSTVLRHTGESETLLVTTVTEVSPPFLGVPQIWRSRSGYKSIAVSFCDQLVCSRLLATPAHPPAWLQRRIVSFLSGSSRLLSGSWYIFTLLIRHAE
jgi:hypothetical protein